MALILWCFSSVPLFFYIAGLHQPQIQNSITACANSKVYVGLIRHQPKSIPLQLFLKFCFSNFTFYNIKWANKNDWNIVQESKKNIFSIKRYQKHENMQNSQKTRKNMKTCQIAWPEKSNSLPPRALTYLSLLFRIYFWIVFIKSNCTKYWYIKQLTPSKKYWCSNCSKS